MVNNDGRRCAFLPQSALDGLVLQRAPHQRDLHRPYIRAARPKNAGVECQSRTNINAEQRILVSDSCAVFLEIETKLNWGKKALDTWGKNGGRVVDESQQENVRSCSGKDWLVALFFL